MKTKFRYRFLSTVLAVLTVFSVFSFISLNPIAVSAEDQEQDEKDYTVYYTTKYATPEDKLAVMNLRSENENYELWIDNVTAEIAIRNKHTGQITPSNPYNIAESVGTAQIKAQLLSQLIVTYTENGAERIYDSFTEAVCRDQVKVKSLRNGVRVEYSIGRENSNRLVPRVISKDSFEANILSKFPEGSRTYRVMKSYYKLYDINDPTLSESAKASMKSQYPITQQMPIYVFDTSAEGERAFSEVEGYIKQYCPDYSYDMLKEDHNIVGYVNTDAVPALFKVALEYNLESDGLRVTLPASSIRFDETKFSLTNIQVLPYYGCGINSELNNATSVYDGYLFIPDGSGALVNFKDLASAASVTSLVYGADQAYNTLSGTNSKTFSWPVFGTVQKVGGNGPHAADPAVYSGFMALITEGEALTTISALAGGKSYNYNTTFATFSPHPRDSYDLSTVVSGVSAGSMVTVVSERKYTGNLTIKYYSLSDANISKECGFDKTEDYYEASYVGMVNAMRKYMYNSGIIKRLGKDDVKKDIPLYIESFGSIKTEKKILTFPVMVQTALTTFSNLETMSEKLKEAGITNIDYKLRGFFNGGLVSTVANTAKVQSVCGGKKAFNAFLNYAQENDIGVYPEFDLIYANAQGTKMFDGFSYRKHLARTIDDRYVGLREYTSVYQNYRATSLFSISPAFFDEFYTKLQKKLSKFEINGISVSTLGYALNSDFNEDSSYNREDTKDGVTELLERVSGDYSSVMTEGANFYSIANSDKILNVALESSMFKISKTSVPFIGLVLHGNVEFAGEAINLSGDSKYDILKAIENGAGLYFLLSYQNTSDLKQIRDFSRYYSIGFDIWFDDLVKYYSELNNAVSDLQTSLIVNHEFLTGERVVDDKDENDTSDYTVSNSRIVRVTYENGTQFILNYNNYKISCEGYEIDALGYVKLAANN